MTLMTVTMATVMKTMMTLTTITAMMAANEDGEKATTLNSQLANSKRPKDRTERF